MPGLDIVRVRDVGLSSVDDPRVLQWAAEEGRIVLTHDVSTMSAFAYDRVHAGHRMPGVLEVRRSIPIGVAIEAIVLIVEASFEDEWEGQVRYLQA